MQVFDERDLEEVQAHGSLDSDSFDAELTVMMIFGRKYLSICRRHPSKMMGEAWVTAGWVAGGKA